MTVTMPTSSAVAPPGWYMLFVNEDVDGEVLPSKAVFAGLG